MIDKAKTYLSKRDGVLFALELLLSALFVLVLVLSVSLILLTATCSGSEMCGVFLIGGIGILGSLGVPLVILLLVIQLVRKLFDRPRLKEEYVEN